MSIQFAVEDYKVTFIVKAFRYGKNTAEIAEMVHLKESVVERVLHAGLAAERSKKLRGESECH